MDAKLGHSNIFLVRVCFEGPQTNGPGSLAWFVWPGWEG